MNQLDFMIIGAQKCATTTLFELLNQHSEITMPVEKEVPFFLESHLNEPDWNRFARQHFPTEKTSLWGKATPQYMCNPETAKHIHALMPEIKLIAILRDPTSRTRSHYKMGKRREVEHRNIDDAIAPLLSRSASDHARQRPVPMHAEGFEAESDFYVAWSEYGAALTPYFRLFPRQQILVLYTEDLERDPAGTLDQVLEFIGLPIGFRPRQLGQVMHKGGGENRIAHKTRVKLRKSWLYRAWKLLPDAYQGRLRFLYDRWNSKASNPDADQPSALTTKALNKHFSQDVQQLITLGVTRPPWADAYLSA